jgi:ABC-type multidrug transport system fused ATPase/permease subunit
LNLDIPVGKKIAFVGESGGGKSTIVQLLVRLIEPEGGAITVNGIPLETIRRDDWASKVNLVFQEPYMYPDTIRFNLAFGVNVTDNDIREACAAAQFSETAEALPDGYDTWIGERGAALSGGQKQRIAIARALLADPELLIMDESTSALDSETERLILRSIEKRRNGRTTIFIAHRLSTIESADLIYVLEHGTVTEQGTYAELIERSPVFRRLVQAMRPDAS